MHSGAREYEFTLILSGVPDLTPEVVDGLFDAGCDDATICRRSGQTLRTFSRTAASFGDAILSAVQDVHKANVGASVIRIDE